MAIANLVFNGLFTGDIDLMGCPVLVQLAVLLRIVKRILVNRGLADFLFPLDKVIGAGLNGILNILHILRVIPLAPIPVNVGQRRRRGQQRLRLGRCQIMVLQRNQNILPDGVLIGVIEDLRRGLG